jgi:hypothetical protein
VDILAQHNAPRPQDPINPDSRQAWGGVAKLLRENLPFIIAGKGGGSLNTGRFIADVKGNQGALLTTLFTCMGVPLDRPIGIATKQIKEMMA